MTDTVNVPTEAIEEFRKWYELDRGRAILKGKARKIVARILAAAAPKAEPVSDPDDIETLISDAIGDSMDMDWTSRDGARVVMRALAEEGLLVAVKPEAPKVEQDYAEVKRLAEGASQGPWKACGTIYEHMNCEIRTGAKGEGQPIGQIWDGPNAFADGQFIAAASPEVVLGLIARASSPAPASDELLEALERIEDMAPATCETSLAHEMAEIARAAIAKHKGTQS